MRTAPPAKPDFRPGTFPDNPEPAASAFTGNPKPNRQSARHLLTKISRTEKSVGSRLIMEYRVRYEHSLASAPNDFMRASPLTWSTTFPRTFRVSCSPNSSQT
ncbi:hypothetical protein AC233_31865 [Burkholderia sp. HB1]|nr:hypothetical protein AC233_31865 [Burkholderia sp. HB1]